MFHYSCLTDILLLRPQGSVLAYRTRRGLPFLAHRACPLFTNLGSVVTHYPYDLSVFGRVSAKAASWDTVFLTHISISEIWKE